MDKTEKSVFSTEDFKTAFMKKLERALKKFNKTMKEFQSAVEQLKKIPTVKKVQLRKVNNSIEVKFEDVRFKKYLLKMELWQKNSTDTSPTLYIEAAHYSSMLFFDWTKTSKFVNAEDTMKNLEKMFEDLSNNS